jgi:TonB family protein
MIPDPHSANPHPFDPETVMAYADGQLAPQLSDAVAAHIAQCAQCSEVAAKLRQASSVLARWTVPDSHGESPRLAVAKQRFQRRSATPSARFFQVVRPRYILAGCILTAAFTFWAQQSPSRIYLPEQEMRAKLTKDSAPNPRYPEEARRNGIQGVVNLHLLVAKDGTVKSLKVTSGNPLLAKASEETVKHWKFEPTLVNGKSVEVETNVEITFVLYP